MKGPKFDPSSWRIKVDGLVRRPLDLSFAEFTALPQVTVTKDFVCVEGWTEPEILWKGVTLSELMIRAGVQPQATHLLFLSGDGGYADSLTIAEASGPRPLLAHDMNGAPLTREHGQPVRLVVPGSFGYKSVKWVVEIQAVALGPEGYPGYWEQQGYPAQAEFG